MTINEESIKNDEPNMRVIEEGENSVTFTGKTVLEVENELLGICAMGESYEEGAYEALGKLHHMLDSVLGWGDDPDELYVYEYPSAYTERMTELCMAADEHDAVSVAEIVDERTAAVMDSYGGFFFTYEDNMYTLLNISPHV